MSPKSVRAIQWDPIPKLKKKTYYQEQEPVIGPRGEFPAKWHSIKLMPNDWSLQVSEYIS